MNMSYNLFRFRQGKDTVIINFRNVYQYSQSSIAVFQLDQFNKHGSDSNEYND